MKIGMLWFDNTSRTMEQKIQIAANYYLEKYGQEANVCFVRKGRVAVIGIEVRESNQVQPNHLWIGKEERREPI